MRSQPAPERRPIDVLPFAFLAAFTVVPALIVFVGVDNGRAVFFLYREPKLIATMVLGWLVVASLTWVSYSWLEGPGLVAELKRPPMLWLFGLLAWMWVSSLWSLVPENAVYELQQYSLLFVLMLMLLAWNRHDRRVQSVVVVGLLSSVALLVVVGLLQASGFIGFLEPIDPSRLVHYPSLMGYKNPLAMAILGQFFILVSVAHNQIRYGRLSRALLIGALCAVQLIFLVTLQSRTALLGLVAGALALFAQFLARDHRRRRAIIAAVLLLGILSSMTVLSALNPKVDRKVRSVLSFVTDPASFFESDRGTYLINTLNMTRHRPLGVGVGDWQTHYPLYRIKNRYLWFNDSYQVRRAHSDHVQMLGEIGWPGFVLWVGFLASLVWCTARQTDGRHWPVSKYLTAQLLALVAAMGTDYVVEHPYGKLQFFLVVFLALARGEKGSTTAIEAHHRRGFWRIPLAATLTLVAALHMAYFVQLARKIVVSGHLTRLYLSASASGIPTGDEAITNPQEGRQALMYEMLQEALLFDQLPGHTKTMFRDYLLAADGLRHLGDSSTAEKYLSRSLELHPHHPPSFRLMAELTRGTEASNEWLEGYDNLMNIATVGYMRPYPPGHPLRRSEVD